MVVRQVPAWVNAPRQFCDQNGQAMLFVPGETMVPVGEASQARASADRTSRLVAGNMVCAILGPVARSRPDGLQYEGEEGDECSRLLAIGPGRITDLLERVSERSVRGLLFWLYKAAVPPSAVQGPLAPCPTGTEPHQEWSTVVLDADGRTALRPPSWYCDETNPTRRGLDVCPDRRLDSTREPPPLAFRLDGHDARRLAVLNGGALPDDDAKLRRDAVTELAEALRKQVRSLLNDSVPREDHAPFATCLEGLPWDHIATEITTETWWDPARERAAAETRVPLAAVESHLPPNCGCALWWYGDSLFAPSVVRKPAEGRVSSLTVRSAAFATNLDAATDLALRARQRLRPAVQAALRQLLGEWVDDYSRPHRQAAGGKAAASSPAALPSGPPAAEVLAWALAVSRDVAAKAIAAAQPLDMRGPENSRCAACVETQINVEGLRRVLALTPAGPPGFQGYLNESKR